MKKVLTTVEKYGNIQFAVEKGKIQQKRFSKNQKKLLTKAESCGNMKSVVAKKHSEKI